MQGVIFWDVIFIPLSSHLSVPITPSSPSISPGSIVQFVIVIGCHGDAIVVLVMGESVGQLVMWLVN